ncbi:MAG: ribosome-associated translation inhibitor RaiA [Prevotellaceae bacterium]|jgi:putative sigma-54 modulation protein|nr:ribosome-associated translation inhibitor RaiA [Prevotellaceae bacterium]
MNVKVQSIKFDADKKLIDFIEKKISKLEKFFDGIIGAEVILRLDNHSTDPTDNKKVEVLIKLPGKEAFAERVSKSFEEAVDHCADALKIQLSKAKGKIQN